MGVTVQDYSAPYTIGLFMRSLAAQRWLTGPIGSGKTSGCCVEIARLAAEMPPCLDGVRRSRFLVVRNTVPQLRQTTIKTFHEWFPPNVAGRWHSTEKTFELRMRGVESEIIFRGLDDEKDVANLLSLEVSHAYFNEFREIDQSIVEGTSKRIGRYPSKKSCPHEWQARLFGDSNMPVRDSYWYYVLEGLDPEEDLFGEHPPMEYDHETFHQPGGRSRYAENLENLPENYYNTKGLSAEYIRVMIDAQYGSSLSGKAVWPQFNRDEHVARQVLQPNRALSLLVGLDFGRTPTAVLTQLNLHGQLQVLDELTSVDMGATRFCQRKLEPLIKNKYEGLPLLLIGDPAGNSKSPTDEKSVADVIKAFFPLCYKAARTNLWLPRVEAVENRLLQNTDVGPALLVSPHCTKVIQTLEGGYHYKVKKGVVSDEPEKNAFSHVGDALQYVNLHCDTSTLSLAQRLARQRLRQRRQRRLYVPADRVAGY